MPLKPRCVLITIVAYFLTTDPGPGANQPLSLTLSAVEQTVRPGSEAKVQTTLTNVTSQVVTFFDTNPDCDYLIEVRDEKGNPAEQTTYRRQLSCKNRLGDARNILVKLKPQESRKDEIVLTRLYELNRPGRYFVQAQRKLPKELGGGTVQSNTLTINVTD